MKICIVQDCVGPSHRANNLCDKHHQRLKRHDTVDKPSRLGCNERKWSDEDIKNICLDYITLNLNQMMEKYQTGTKQLYNVLKKHNISLKGNKIPGKDGTITPDGYRKIFRNSKYILEHRYIMEQKIGRQLLKCENVHHINGIRDDNRPENLELWSTSQPSGQRVSDKLEWAKQMIKLYGDKL